MVLDVAAASGDNRDVSGDVEEGVREEPEGRASVCEVGEREGVRPTSTARRGERRAAAWHACSAHRRAPACLCWRVQAARWRRRWVGLVGGPAGGLPGKPFSFCILFSFFIYSVTLGL